MGVGHGRIEAADRRRALGRGRARDRHARAGQRGRARGPGDLGADLGPRARGRASRWSAPTAWASPPRASPSPWIGSLHPTFVRGPVATLVHSGSIGEILVSLGPRIGFRTVISAGNETVTDAADFVACFADDPDTPRGRALPRGACAGRRRSRRRCAGSPRRARSPSCSRSARPELGAQAALAHTGALVGSDRSFSAMLRHYDAIRVRRLRRLARAHGGLLARAARRAARRIGAITNSGGEGEYFADKAEQAGIPLAALLRRAARADHGRVPELRPRRQPGRLLGDRRRPGRLPARVPADGRVGRVRRAACRRSTTPCG